MVGLNRFNSLDAKARAGQERKNISKKNNFFVQGIQKWKTNWNPMEKGIVNDCNCNRYFEIDEIVLKIRKKHLHTVRPLNKVHELISNLTWTVKGATPSPTAFFDSTFP